MKIWIHEREIHRDGEKKLKKNSPKIVKFTNRLKGVKIFYIKTQVKSVLQLKKKTKWSKRPTPSNHNTLRKLRKLSEEKGWLLANRRFAWMRTGKEIRRAEKEFEVQTKNAQTDLKNLSYQKQETSWAISGTIWWQKSSNQVRCH